MQWWPSGCARLKNFCSYQFCSGQILGSTNPLMGWHWLVASIAFVWRRGFLGGASRMCFRSASPVLITLFKQRVLDPASDVTLFSWTRSLHSNSTAADHLKIEDKRSLRGESQVVRFCWNGLNVIFVYQIFVNHFLLSVSCYATELLFYFISFYIYIFSNSQLIKTASMYFCFKQLFKNKSDSVYQDTVYL